MVHVLIADDHAMFREMLRLALPRNGDIEIVGETDNGRDITEAVDRSKPDVVLLDYRMPHVKNFALMVRAIHERHGGTRIVLLSAFASPDIAARAAEAGVRGYVLKTTRLAAVSEAVRAVAAGAIWIDPSLPRTIFEVFQRRAKGPLAGNGEMPFLTRREREILACVAEGTSNHDIAQKLFIAEPTVKTHLSHIYSKLCVKNRVGAALAYHGKIAAPPQPFSERALQARPVVGWRGPPPVSDSAGEEN